MMVEDKRQEELGSALRDLRVTLASEADLAALALAGAQDGALGALAEAAEELLQCHADFAAAYRKVLSRWLRPRPAPDGTAVLVQ